ncbi:MAG: lysophospholipid acyltransferase family protein [Kofleriaceae bacterium]
MDTRTGATLALRAAGWAFEGERPTIPKYVCLAVPHTSNWDGALLLMVAQAIGLPMAWMIKDSWVRGPVGAGLRRLGAVAIDRSRANNLVDQMVAEFERRDEFVLVIPPEGTRRRTDAWKSGFYHIALGAQVPVVPGYLDYGRKRAGLGAPIEMTGDVRADMDALRAFYAEMAPTPHTPANFGPIRLKAEDDAR